MAEEEEPTNLTQPTRPALLTYKKKKSRFPSTTSHSQHLFKSDLALSHSCGLNSHNPNPNSTPNRYDFATCHNLGQTSNDRCLPVPKLLVKNKNMASGNLLEKRVDDKDLAIQLHLEMNGSRRVSRKKVHSGLVSGPGGKAKRGKLELYRQRLSLGSIGVKNSKIINAGFNGTSVGSNYIVLALECTKCLFEPLSELRQRCRILNKYSKRKKMQNGNGHSVVGSENKGDKNENKYDKKNEALPIPFGNSSHSQSVSDRYQKKYDKRKRTLEGMLFANSGRQNGSKPYVNKYYKRRTCLKKLVDSNGNENMAGRFLNKFYKRRQLSVTIEDGTCVGTCTAYNQNESDRYLKKYSKTRKRKLGMGGEQSGIDRFMKKYSKRRLSLSQVAVIDESQYNGVL